MRRRISRLSEVQFARTNSPLNQNTLRLRIRAGMASPTYSLWHQCQTTTILAGCWQKKRAELYSLNDRMVRTQSIILCNRCSGLLRCVSWRNRWIFTRMLKSDVPINYGWSSFSQGGILMVCKDWRTHNLRTVLTARAFNNKYSLPDIQITFNEKRRQRAALIYERFDKSNLFNHPSNYSSLQPAD